MKSTLDLFFSIVVTAALTSSGAPLSIIDQPQPGDLDRSFASGGLTNGTVLSIAIQPDEKVLIGGSFTTFNGQPRAGVARLNSNGSLDGFDARIWGPDYRVFCVAVQGDGRVVVGGENMRVWEDRFERVYPQKSLVRFSGRSEALMTFGRASSILPAPDGRLLVGGSPGVGGWSALPSNSWVNAIALQADGKTLLGGSFGSASSIVRLSFDGTLDEDFRPGVSDSVGSIAVQPDQKILIGGSFPGCIARLNPDGTMDTDFQPVIPRSWYLIRSLVLQRDGKVLVGGVMQRGVPGEKLLLRLNRDGTEDSTFRGPISMGQSDNAILSIALQSDKRILIGGHFTQIHGIPAANIARLWGDDPPPTINTLARTGTDVTLSWRALPNRTYRVQYSEDLSPDTWADLEGDVFAVSELASKTDTTSSYALQRFYRVLLLP